MTVVEAILALPCTGAPDDRGWLALRPEARRAERAGRVPRTAEEREALVLRVEAGGWPECAAAMRRTGWAK